MIQINNTTFTPYTAIIGGLLIGFASALLILGIGRIAGISSITANAVRLANIRKDCEEHGLPWELTFLLGMITSAWIYSILMPFPNITISNNILLVTVAGIFVGFGTRLGSGCTSGHGVCGISRLSYRSLTATLTFVTMGFFTVYVMKNLFR